MGTHTFIRRGLFLLVAGVLIAGLQGEALAGLKSIVVGNDQRQWAQWGTMEGVDNTSRPGWIQPTQTSRAVNILNQLFQKKRLFPGKQPVDKSYKPGDGRLWTPNAGFGENVDLLRIADGQKDSVAFEYFNRPTNNNGVTIYVDLGAAFPMDEIRFYPLDYDVHQDLYLKGFELHVNDGRPETFDDKGEPIFRLLRTVPRNSFRETIIKVELQHIRFVRLKSTSAQPFEIDQLEIRGEGFVQQAVFTSKIIDLGDLANLGAIRWSAIEEAGTSMKIQTRVGRDKTTLIYHRVNEIGEQEELTGETDEENRKTWEALLPGAKGPIVPDEKNWSFWSEPYKTPGDRIISEGPRQFAQFRITMSNETGQTKASVDSVALEFSQPVVARRLLGDVLPKENVPLGRTQLFTYKVRPTIKAGDTGFDRIQMTTPSGASVREVRVGGKVIPRDRYTVEVEKRKLTVHLSNIEDRITTSKDSLELLFDTTVLSFVTVFPGIVEASWEVGSLGQRVEEERSGDMTVLSNKSSLGGVLGDLKATPNPFTPNGDRVNDTTTISFNFFQVIGTAPVSVEIHDTAGRRVRILFDHTTGADQYVFTWDGRDDRGALVQPGIYLYRVLIEADTQEFAETGVISVVY
ncbi:MAG: gliding motility-associated C-terminal domain-containing protein [Candidatus Latescibacteria bacterium]|nr:gliding motility-associated C-terminal domain-containing protein [Candidatus Latescibacterota bacterium]